MDHHVYYRSHMITHRLTDTSAWEQRGKIRFCFPRKDDQLVFLQITEASSFQCSWNIISGAVIRLTVAKEPRTCKDNQTGEDKLTVRPHI